MSSHKRTILLAYLLVSQKWTQGMAGERLIRVNVRAVGVAPEMEMLNVAVYFFL